MILKESQIIAEDGKCFRGGHLAASLGVNWEKPYVQDIPGIIIGMNRPNALILSYPVITAGTFAHQGSFQNLLGDQPNKELLHEMSLEHHVYEYTPPAFMHTVEDTSVPVENSLLFVSQLRNKNIPFELHIYPEGPHGLSLATAETDNGNSGNDSHVATWMKLCIEWLEKQFR